MLNSYAIHTHTENIGKSNDIKRWMKKIQEEYSKKNKNKNDRKKYYKQIDETKKLTAGGSMILSLYYILRTNEWSLCQRVFVCRFEI